MSIVVEHEKRKKEILDKALDVFMEEGFEDATFQKISDRCGITRTTLYVYFKNKKEIFNYSIKQLLTKVEVNIRQICADTTLDSTTKLTKVLLEIMERLTENRRLLFIVLEYLLYISRTDSDPDVRVRRRTIRLRHILSSLIIEGINRGELAPINGKMAFNYLYSFIEASIFRLVVLQQKSVEDLRPAVIEAVMRLKA